MLRGRGGRGVVFAAGNEDCTENVNFEGFLMSIYTISVASTDPPMKDHTIPRLVLLCPSVLQEGIHLNGLRIW